MTNRIDRFREAVADQYAIGDVLGRGGMATVYRALERQHDRTVAIKILRPEIADAVGEERFLREIRIAARLSHPHIVPLLSSGQAAELLYYVMPLIEGESLRARLEREGQLAIGAALQIVHEVAGALTYAHAHGIVHRDIKPENVMLAGGRAIVTDFGIATAVETAGAERLTTTGLSVGTPTYMSPEQTAGRVDGRSDIYSLGCVLYEMLAGEPPFTGPTQLAILARHATDQMRPLRTVRQTVPPAVERALLKALAKVPVDRFATADEFAAALLANEPEPVTVPTRPPPERSIAVLPFADLSQNRDLAYLCDGIAEELLNSIARLGTLRVASRTSAFAFREHSLDVREIGRRLNVTSVLEGTVRAADGRLRVSVTLTGVEEGFQLWSERYDREMTAVFEVQDEIARTVVTRLLPHLGAGGAPVVAPGAMNVDAYHAYLKGRHFANRRTEAELRRAVECFEQALAREPGFALAGAALADAWLMLAVYGASAPEEAMPRAKAAVAGVMASGQESAEALAVQGSVRAVYDWDWTGAEADLRRALALSPNNPTVLHRYAMNCLLPQRRFTEARAALTQALAADPLALVIAASLGLGQYFERRLDEAITQLRGVIDLDPGFGLANYFLGLALLAAGAPDAAAESLERAVSATNKSSETVSALGAACAGCGRRADAERLLDELEATGKARYVSPALPAQILTALGRYPEALTRLEEAVERRATEAIWLAVRPTFDALRSDARFRALVCRIGLPE